MKEKVKEDARQRLARMSGQVTGIAKMVEDERYCVDILTQIAALRAALENFGSIIVSCHLEDCVYGAPSADQSAEERLEEIRKTLQRFLS